MRNISKILIIIGMCVIITIMIKHTIKRYESVMSTYEVTYQIHYPSFIDTATCIGDFRKKPVVTSSEGTNRIYDAFTGTECISTTAPIKITKITKIK